MAGMNYQACQFVWKIENYNVSTLQKREFIMSPMFQTKILDGTWWCICLMYEGDADEGYISVYLQGVLLKERRTSFDLTFEVSLLNDHGTPRYTQRVSRNCDSSSIGIYKFVQRKDIFEENTQLLLKEGVTLKGRIGRPSLLGAAPEKILIRSRLAAERRYFIINCNRRESSQICNIDSKAVQGGFNLSCKWDLDLPSVLRFPNITIEPQEETTSWIFMSANMYILDEFNKPVFHTKDCHCFDAGCTVPWWLPNINETLKDSRFRDYFDDMNLVCEITISDSMKEEIYDTMFSDQFENLLQKLDNPRNDIGTDFKSVLPHATFPDMHIKVGEGRIPAHRVVLSARSPVFRTILENAEKNLESSTILNGLLSLVGFAGRKSNQCYEYDQTELSDAVRKCGVSVSRSNGELFVAFSGVEERIVRKIVSFLYTDTVGCVDHDTAMELLRASDKYQIKGLKNWCASFLKTTITVDNVCSTLIAAHELKCIGLKTAALLFMNEASDCVLHSLKFQTLNHEDKNFAVAFLRSIQIAYR